MEMLKHLRGVCGLSGGYMQNLILNILHNGLFLTFKLVIMYFIYTINIPMYYILH